MNGKVSQTCPNDIEIKKGHKHLYIGQAHFLTVQCCLNLDFAEHI